MRYAGKPFVAVVAALVLMAELATAQTADTLRVDKAAETEAAQQGQEQDEDEGEDAEQEPQFDRNAPVLSANAEPRLYYIRKVNIHGIRFRDKDLLLSTSGLIPGDSLYLPSTFISIVPRSPASATARMTSACSRPSAHALPWATRSTR